MSKRAAAKAATRAKCLEAARTLWAEPGSLNTVGARDLAKAMGMSTGAIFSCFDGLHDLWRAAFKTEPPIDSVMTRAAPTMAELLRTATVQLRDAGHAETADRIDTLLATLTGAA